MNLPHRAYQYAVGCAGRHLPGEPVWGREWDILCVLDGCRHDTFADVYDGEAGSLWSVASTSQTWIPRTFGGRDLSTVGYLTGNPYSSRLPTDEFAYYHAEPVRAVAGVETVPPRALTRRAIDVWRRRDELGIERLVVHYMQPHAPFRSRPDLTAEYRGTSTWGGTVWRKIARGDVDRDEFMQAYADNLRWVLGGDGIETLKRNADAKIALTADHGNAAGEWGFYGHPKGAPVASVRRVPWATVEGVDTMGTDPTPQAGSDELDTTRQLSALGYTP